VNDEWFDGGAAAMDGISRWVWLGFCGREVSDYGLVG
jgi:hypothetical protein